MRAIAMRGEIAAFWAVNAAKSDGFCLFLAFFVDISATTLCEANRIKPKEPSGALTPRPCGLTAPRHRTIPAFAGVSDKR
jgi:hypothetical protein